MYDIEDDYGSETDRYGVQNMSDEQLVRRKARLDNAVATKPRNLERFGDFNDRFNVAELTAEEQCRLNDNAVDLWYELEELEHEQADVTWSISGRSSPLIKS